MRDPFPNVVFVTGASQEFEAVTHDDMAMPPVDISGLRGMFQHDPLYFHKTLERFIDWENRPKLTIWKCIIWCSPPHGGDEVILIHYEENEKKNQFYLVELADVANSPIIFARTKFRKEITFNTDFVSMKEPKNKKEKPKVLTDFKMSTLWHVLYFDSTEKIVAMVCVLLANLIWFYLYRKSDDEDDDDYDE